MARDHAEINLGIWGDADFRALPPDAQHLYFVLWTAADLSYCGVTRWHPGKIAQRAEGWTAGHVIRSGSVLVDRHFIVVDEEPEEVLLRSWIRWDGLLAQPIMAVSMAKAFGAVDSNTIRGVLVHELQKLEQRDPGLKGWTKPQVKALLTQPALDAKTLSNPLAKGSDNPSANPPSNPYEESGAKGSPNTPSTPTPTPTPTPEDKSSFTNTRAERGTRITEDWKPSAKILSDLGEKYPDVDLDDQIERFIDYWTGITGQRGVKTMRGWDGAFRNWVKKANEDLQRRPYSQATLPGGNYFSPPPPPDDMPAHLFAAWNRAHNQANRDGRPGPEDWHELAEAS